MSYYKYFPSPYASVNEDGEILLEWIAKEDKARLLIVFDNSKDLGELESNIYACYVSNTESKIIPIHTIGDVLKALGLLRLKPE